MNEKEREIKNVWDLLGELPDTEDIIKSAIASKKKKVGEIA